MKVINSSEDTALVKPSTGEIIDFNIHAYMTKEEDEQNQQKKQNRKKGYEYYLQNIKPLPGFLQEQYGNFIHTQYESLLKQINNDSATAFRYIYLCTYMNYDDGYILWNNRKIKSDTLIDIFNVSSRLITNIKKDLYNNNLILKDKDGYIKVNTKYCYRGNLKETHNYKQHCTRVFNDSIQQLYKKSDPREHKLLGIFILILPYINIYHNIICMNVREKNIEKLQLPSTAEFEKILQCSNRNSNKRLKDLLQITVGDKPALLMIRHKNCQMYAVNPSIYYSGTNIQHINELNSYFDAKGGL